METALYEIVSHDNRWFVRHDGEESGPYATKEAAFQAVVPPISLTIHDGLGVQLMVEPGIKTPDENPAPAGTA